VGGRVQCTCISRHPWAIAQAPALASGPFLAGLGIGVPQRAAANEAASDPASASAAPKRQWAASVRWENDAPICPPGKETATGQKTWRTLEALCRITGGMDTRLVAAWVAREERRTIICFSNLRNFERHAPRRFRTITHSGTAPSAFQRRLAWPLQSPGRMRTAINKMNAHRGSEPRASFLNSRRNFQVL